MLSYDTVEDTAPQVTEANLKIVRDALHGVATENESVAADFNKYSWSAAAKTGTAEVAGKQDMAWFSCYAPYDNPKFALCVCVEEGGSGGTVGSPLAAQIMDAAIQSSSGSFDEDMSPIAATEVSVGGSN